MRREATSAWAAVPRCTSESPQTPADCASRVFRRGLALARERSQSCDVRTEVVPHMARLLLTEDWFGLWWVRLGLAAPAVRLKSAGARPALMLRRVRRRLLLWYYVPALWLSSSPAGNKIPPPAFCGRFGFLSLAAIEREHDASVPASGASRLPVALELMFYLGYN